MIRRKTNWIISLVFFLLTPNYLSAQSIDDLNSKIDELKTSGNKTELANTYRNLANLYWQSGELEKAIANFKDAIAMNKELGNTNAERIILGYIGLVNLEKEDFNSAINFFRQSLDLNIKAGKTEDIISDQYNIAYAYQMLGDYTKSNEYAKLSLEKSQEIDNLSSTKSCFLLLAENYDKLGEKKTSAEYYDNYTAINSYIQKEQVEKLQNEKQKIASEKQQLQSEKKQVEADLEIQANKVSQVEEELRLKQELSELQHRQLTAEKEQSRTRTKYFISILTLVLAILVLFFVQNQRRKAINKKLKDQNTEIERQKTEIEKQRDLADKQRKNLTDSIQYARRIQSAVIPRPESLFSHFKDSFILYKPRDIVSGDFYWFAQKENLFIVAAADCTGHGVPGAFMSMLGVAYLNEIINKIAVNIHINALNADEILNQLREKVITSLHQSDNKRESKDGMDIALCIIDTEKKKLQFAGAYNPLLIIRNNEVIKLKGDKMPVSYHRKHKVPFSRQDIDLNNNDCLYLLSDGFVDQFGGKDKTKFLMTRFTEKILEIHKKPMFEQKGILSKVYDDWKGENPQIDDVLVIGIRFSKEIATDVVNWEDKTILIAEDTDINYFLIAEVLKKTKVKLLRVKNGLEAVDKIKAEPVDLILMDINMPTMDGFEATKQIKEINRNIPVIMQTAIHSDGYKHSLEAGADDFLSKPIDLKTFMNKISRYLT